MTTNTTSEQRQAEADAHLTALCEAIRGLHLRVEMLGDGPDRHLRIGPEHVPLAKIQCAERVDDDGKLWFFGLLAAGGRTVVAEASDVAGALLAVKTLQATREYPFKGLIEKDV